MVETHVRRMIQEQDEKKVFGGHKTIFSEILESDLPASEKQVSRLKDEAGVIIGAGSDTIKHALTIASYHILSDKEIERTLVEELVKAMPDRDSTLTWAELETLPYLTAVLQEGISSSSQLWKED
jgi:cytochrome P450